MKLIIAGGTGLIGSALAESLLSDGHEVGIISRTPNRIQHKYFPVSWDESSLSKELAGSDAVINLAGASLAGDNPLKMRWTATRKQAIISSRQTAGKKLSDAISSLDQKPEVFLQASAIGYYGNQGFDPADETSGAGSDFLADVCREWETSSAGLEQLGLRRLVLRIGLVLSPSGGLLSLLALPFRFFVGGKIGSGSQYLSWIHIQDIVDSIKFLIADQRLQGVYNLSAPNPETNHRFSQLLGKTLNRPSWLPVPASVLKIAFGEASTLALDGRPVHPTRLQEAGYQFSYTQLDDCLQDLIKS